MTKPIDFDRLAIKEIGHARRTYARIRTELSTRFLTSLYAASARVAHAPQACSPHLFGTRIAPLLRFPYWIVFVEEPQCIIIFAVMHSSRRPGYWRRRLS